MVNKFEQIPIQESSQEKKKREEAEKIAGRRGFLKGAAILGAAGAASHVENKGQKLAKAIDFISKAFRHDDEKEQGLTDKEEKLLIERINSIEQAEYDNYTKEELKDSIDEEKAIPEQERKSNAQHYLDAFLELEKNKDYFPDKLFEHDFLIAQQLQESGYDKNAKSHAGAIGVMQIMPICIKDDSIFLERLHNQGVIDYKGPIYIGHLENEKKNLEDPGKKFHLSAKDRKARISQLDRIIKQKKEKYKDRILTKSGIDGALLLSQMNPDFSRAYGKTYLMRLFNNEHGFGIGQKEFEKGDIEAAQEKLLGSYNAGPRAAKYKKEEWKKALGTEEPATYVDRIRENMKNIRMARKKLKEEKISPELENPIVMRIARSMNKNQDPDIKNEIFQYYMDKILLENVRKQGKLTEDEVIAIFLPLHEKSTITKKDLI